MVENKPIPGINMDPTRFSFKLPGIPYPQVEEKPSEEESVDKDMPSIRVTHRYGHRHISRKASSEEALSKALDWYFSEGDCYHCFSFGDVDSLTFFKHVLRQQRVYYLALSTWCILARRDEARMLFEESGGNIIVNHTNKAGATNLEQNPILRMVNDLNRDALAYWRDLGLTPAGLKRIDEKSMKQRKKSPLDEALKGIG